MFSSLLKSIALPIIRRNFISEPYVRVHSCLHWWKTLKVDCTRHYCLHWWKTLRVDCTRHYCLHWWKTLRVECTRHSNLACSEKKNFTHWLHGAELLILWHNFSCWLYMKSIACLAHRKSPSQPHKRDVHKTVHNNSVMCTLISHFMCFWSTDEHWSTYACAGVRCYIHR